MIYIRDIKDGEGNSFNISFNHSFARTKGYQTIYIPRHFEQSDNLTLVLTSVAELTKYSYQVKDLGGSENYYRVKFPLKLTAPDGEYNFRLLSGDVVVSEGIIIKHGCGEEIKQYEQDIEYKQYETEEC